jgi:undecaprenyl-diphosphatase
MNILSYFAEHFDLPILDWIAEHLQCGFLDAVMPVITALGNGGIFWIALALVMMIIPKYRKAGFSMGLALIMGLLVCNLTLKPLVGRMRPYDYQLEFFGKSIDLLIATPHDFSFPSGHTIASFEGAVALLIHDRKLGIPALVLAVLIAFSRLYLYVHYPTDVLASIILGVGFAFLGSFIVKKGFQLWEKRKTAS